MQTGRCQREGGRRRRGPLATCKSKGPDDRLTAWPRPWRQMLRKVWIAAASVPLAAALNTGLGGISVVHGEAMQPGLADGDVVLVRRSWTLQAAPYKPGDVVEYTCPFDPSASAVARVLAVQETFVDTRERGVLKVDHSRTWLERDNRDAPSYNGHVCVRDRHTGERVSADEPTRASLAAADSCAFGAIPNVMVTGKALCVLWPLTRLGRVKSEFPPGRRCFDASVPRPSAPRGSESGERDGPAGVV